VEHLAYGFPYDDINDQSSVLILLNAQPADELRISIGYGFRQKSPRAPGGLCGLGATENCPLGPTVLESPATGWTVTST